MLYHFNEGSIQAPDALKDRTLHTLVPYGAGVGFTLVIGRDELEPGETPEAFLDRQLNELAKQVSKFQQTHRETIYLGGSAKGIAGIRLEFQFKQRNQMIYQRQGVFLMPDKKTILSFTGSAAAPFDAAQKKLWDEAIASFTPRA